MQDDRNNVAALNNAEWCAAVWRSHGLPVEQAQGMWLCRRPTPQYYPNVVTVDAGTEPAKQARLIAELARDGDPDYSVKDSFSCLDLSDAGFRTLFDARWLYPGGSPGRQSQRIPWIGAGSTMSKVSRHGNGPGAAPIRNFTAYSAPSC